LHVSSQASAQVEQAVHKHSLKQLLKKLHRQHWWLHLLLVSWPVSTQEAAQTAVDEAVPVAQVALASAATGQLAAAKAALAVVFQAALSPTAQRSSSANVVLIIS